MKVWRWESLRDGTVKCFTDEEVWQNYLDNIEPKRPWRRREDRWRLLDQMQFPLVQRLLGILARRIDNVEAIRFAIDERDNETHEVAKLKQQLHDLELENAWDNYDSNHFRPNDELLRLLGIKDLTYTVEADVQFYGAYLATGRTERRQVAERVYQRASQDLKNGPQED